MDSFIEFFDLISANESVLSGIAAMLAIGGVTLAAGIRLFTFVERKRPATEVSASRVSAPSPRKTSGAKPTVGVLPFRNLSNEEERGFFAEGLTDDLIAGLSLARHLAVKSRSVTFGLRGQEIDLQEIGRGLGIEYIVEGSVRPMGDRLRINVQLVDSEGGDTLWTQKYDRPAAELFEIQDEVIAGITSALGATISRVESVRASSLTPNNLSAWQAVQRASFYRGADGNSEQETNRSIDELRSAVKSDPSYAYAHSMLAWILFYRAINGLTDDARADIKEGMPHLEKGLSLAAEDPFNLNICGGAQGYIGRFEESEATLDRALEIDPNFADAWFNLVTAYRMTGRFDEAEQALNRVEELAPNGPMSRYYDWYRSEIRSNQGRFEEAAELQRATIAKAPSYTSPYMRLALSLAHLGREEEATATLRQMLRVNPRLTPARLSIIESWHPDAAEGAKDMRLLESLWPDDEQQ